MNKKRVVALIVVIFFMLFLLAVKHKIDRWADARVDVSVYQ